MADTIRETRSGYRVSEPNNKKLTIGPSKTEELVRWIKDRFSRTNTSTQATLSSTLQEAPGATPYTPVNDPSRQRNEKPMARQVGYGKSKPGSSAGERLARGLAVLGLVTAGVAGKTYIDNQKAPTEAEKAANTAPPPTTKSPIPTIEPPEETLERMGIDPKDPEAQEYILSRNKLQFDQDYAKHPGRKPERTTPTSSPTPTPDQKN